MIQLRPELHKLVYAEFSLLVISINQNIPVPNSRPAILYTKNSDVLDLFVFFFNSAIIGNTNSNPTVGF